MSFDAIAPLAHRAALFVALRQEALDAVVDGLGEHRWDADIPARTITFTAVADPSRQIIARAHLIATLAPEPRSLLWAWAHPQGDGEGVTTLLREYGETHGIRTLTEAEVDFPAGIDGDLDAWIAAAAQEIGAVAVEIAGRSPYYSVPVEGGTRAVFLLDTPLPPLTVAAAVGALPRLLASLQLADPRTAVWDLARLAAWNLEWTDEAYSGVSVSDASGAATIRFDEQARVTGIESAVGALPLG